MRWDGIRMAEGRSTGARAPVGASFRPGRGAPVARARGAPATRRGGFPAAAARRLPGTGGAAVATRQILRWILAGRVGAGSGGAAAGVLIGKTHSGIRPALAGFFSVRDEDSFPRLAHCCRSSQVALSRLSPRSARFADFLWPLYCTADWKISLCYSRGFLSVHSC